MVYKEVYGYIVIPKDTILYHMNNNKYFTYKTINEKPFLFCVFHPSEYIGFKYIHFIKLKQNVKLLFMIDDIIGSRIYSALPNIIINHQRENLSKLNINVLRNMKDILKEEHLNGWFTSIENKTAVEVAILNKHKFFECIGTIKFIKDWDYGDYNNNDKIILKRWGTLSLSFITKPIMLYINKRFKQKIKDYKKEEKKSKFIREYVFQYMLDNAMIQYFS